ncbi:MAG TPA: 3-deoxy-D-manno-octulosonate 8-phosphate phosphatase [Bacteroidales bacterium]|nr:MAG: 3-deoxy-D-manno-octulosonate 8-phosphate phosphatase [Bacteroidetes bacterium GWE2_42_24]OFY31738.1 MAG: 3-deoxy-D-manno-octulosonate 8-phosphate phosphatase [Bacteroidetes bacterium GWF2_43_11]HAQ64467.1 3-deoxy-D-manno-octulosonate 8-phosphate phosphatase [Bacteroidales bacterium]HBZ67081.1 3-deoxy-D-manno-octulosonate 8-phosphate phosphatase [Bacteroidales bacterium]
MSNYKDLLPKITTFIFDYDGVLTDGSVIMLPDGEGLRSGHVKDGYALQLAIKKGYRVVIISGGRSASMERRMESLHIQNVFLGVNDKLAVFRKFCADNNIQPENVLYMGDDIPDHKVMLEVGVACCPLDAAQEIKNISHYISHLPGGRGCVRDIIEQVMKIHGKWMNGDAYHW